MYFKYLLLFFVVTVFGEENRPLVKLPQGKVHGVVLETPKGKQFEAFLGIPYAKPPIGELRFQEPKPLEKWIGTYNASTYGSDCLQFTHFSYSMYGSEDCLFLNVYRPATNKKTKGKLLDVIVHIHGGAFMFLSGKSFQPKKLFDFKDIVYVSLNYRLGPLGFMSTGDKHLPGNLGLKDQSFALRWIKDNIKIFGGDPNKITITGLSAGGASVHYHILSPMSRGLFERGISASGCALNPWSFTEDVPKKTRIIAARLGCPTKCSKELVECLTSRPAEQIVAQVPLFLKWLYNPYSPFGPTIESADSENPFLSRHPYDIIKDGQAAQVPWLVSFTSEEGLYPAAEIVDNKDLMAELESRWFEIAPHLLDFNYTVPIENQNDVTKRITDHYLNGQSLNAGRDRLVQMMSDRLFGAGLVQSAIMHAAVADKTVAPVFLYRFNYRGKFSVSELFSHSETDFGVCHGDDIGYILTSELFHMDQTEQDREMTNRMANLWLKFAENGSPEFFPGKQLPLMQNGVPNVNYLSIKSIDVADEDTVNDLAEFRFWSTLDIQEKLQLPPTLTRKQDEL